MHKKKIPGEPVLEGASDVQLNLSTSSDPIDLSDLFREDTAQANEFAQAQEGPLDHILRQEQERQQEIIRLGTGSYQRTITATGVDRGFAIPAQQRVQTLTQEINKYITGNYSEVFADRLQRAGYVEPRGLVQKAKILADQKSKVRISEKKSGSKEFDEIAKLQVKLENEPDLIKKLQLKEEIIACRNRGLRSLVKATSTDELTNRGKTEDLLLSEQMELAALYQSELNILDQEKGDEPDYDSQTKRDYAALLKAKIAETNDIVQKKESRRKDLNLASLLSRAYKNGETEYKKKYTKVKRDIRTVVNKTEIQQACQADITEFGDKKLEIKAIKNDKTGEVKYEDSIGAKYSKILSMDFTSIQHFEATKTTFEHMGKDIETICKDKSKSYKEYTSTIETVTKAKEELDKNPDLTVAQKEEQKKGLDEQIDVAKKAMEIIELEMDQLLKYEFFRERINRLHWRFSQEDVAHIIADIDYIFDYGTISFKNYDYSKVGKILQAKTRDIKLLGKPRSEDYYQSLI